MVARMVALAAFPLGLLPGCVAVVPAGPASSTEYDGRLTRVRYETGPCFGACPVYRLTLQADGQGTFEGIRYTGVAGMHGFTVTPEQAERFFRHLAPLRPVSGSLRYSGEACGMMATDLPSVEVTWTTAAGAEQQLYFYYGCGMEKNRALGERLRQAPDLLPIGHLVRPPEGAPIRR